MVKHATSFKIETSAVLEVLCGRFKTDIEPEILPEHEIIKCATAGMTALSMITKHAKVMHPGNTTNYYNIPVEFGGFCAWSLVKRDGLVVPGDKGVGMVRYKERVFAFSDFNKALEFFQMPDENIDAIVSLAKSSPGYVQLLHLYKFFPTVDTLENANSFTRQQMMSQIPIVCEAGSQVDTHLVAHEIHLNYKWNEWDLRRDALMLVNLKKKVTHGSQTAQSHFKRDSETQHYRPRYYFTLI